MPTIGRIIGGAGTGKTTALMELMEKALAQGDLDPMQVGFASFTRAARREAAERAAVKFGYKAADLESAGWFRTVHSVCYRVLSTKSGELLTGDKASARWVEEILQASVEPAFDDTDDPTLSLSWGSTEAGVALSLWQAARNRMEPLEATWRRAAAIDERVPDLEYCTETIRLYESAKVVHNRCDFVDLLGRFAGVKFDAEGHRMTDPLGEVPGLAVWFFDEQQDASPLIDMCCKRLITAPTVRWSYVVGDPFQSIYSFGGADSRCFRAWDVAKERTLPKSYRCPAPILDLGESVLRGCDDYFDRGIAPADHAGDVRFENDLNSVIDGILPGEQWLLVARTNFHARRLANLVDRSGIPWAPTRGNGGWLAPVKMKALCALQNLQEGVPIDVAEWQAILKNVPTKHENAELLVRGTKARWDSDEANDGSLILPGELESVGATPELTQRIADGRWQELIPDSRRFIQACERWGMEAVTKIGCRVGTIHSVKGMEADNVLLLTSTSGRVQRSAEVPELADEERRIAYVGVTRARRNLVVLDEPREKNRMEVE